MTRAGRKAGQSLLRKAKSAKKDEFYTQLCDIERELQYYTDSFQDKIVYCNCDDPATSNFHRYFVNNFRGLKLKKVISSCYAPNLNPLFGGAERGFFKEYDGEEKKDPGLVYLNGDGDFRSRECLNLLAEADIVVTNPPFSLFREFLKTLINNGKKFLVVANVNAITYKEVFNLISKNEIWLGVNMGRGISGFVVPDDYDLYGLETSVNDSGERIISQNNCLWLTNLENSARAGRLALSKKYKGNEEKYPFFDNYRAINVNKTRDIPVDYKGEMGVPITFLHKYNPEQFEIVKFRKGYDDKDLTVNGKPTYFRIIIRPIAAGQR